MPRQLLIYVETRTDGVDIFYIKEALNRFYTPADRNNKIDFEKLKSKSKAKSFKILKEIYKKRALFTGETVVIFCLDTDKIFSNSEDTEELTHIEDYCNNNDFELVWFCRDIEEVFIGNKVPDKEKVKRASAYRQNKEIQNLDIRVLESTQKKIHYSNLLKVMDRYLERI